MSYVVPINILFNADVMWDVMNATQWTTGLHPESSALHPDKTCNRDFIYGIFIVHYYTSLHYAICYLYHILSYCTAVTFYGILLSGEV